MVAPLFGHTLLPSLAFSAWLTRELICISGGCVCGAMAKEGGGGGGVGFGFRSRPVYSSRH